MILVPSFDIPSGFRLGKITEECPFQGPVFFGLRTLKSLINVALRLLFFAIFSHAYALIREHTFISFSVI